MLGNTRLSKQFRNIIKILGVAIAVYLALTLKIWLTWESDEVTTYDYLQQEEIEEWTEINENHEETEENEHWSSSIFSKLCKEYNDTCKKVNWWGNFSDEDKAIKFAYVVYLLQTLDKNIKRWTDTPSKTLIAMLINESKWTRRWSANRNSMTINVWWMKYDNEFFQVISHEFGHIVDLWVLQWISSTKSQNFTEFEKAVFSIDDPSLEYYKYSRSSEKIRKNWMTKENFCSSYWMSDPFEDFAECHNLYLNHHDYFHHIALTDDIVKNKYNFMSNLYGWKYINDSEAKYEDWANSYRARDTTKLREW